MNTYNTISTTNNPSQQSKEDTEAAYDYFPNTTNKIQSGQSKEVIEATYDNFSYTTNNQSGRSKEDVVATYDHFSNRTKINGRSEIPVVNYDLAVEAVQVEKKDKEKLKLSSKNKDCFLVKIALFVICFIAIVIGFGILGKQISDAHQEKEVLAKAFILSRADIEQLKNNNKQQNMTLNKLQSQQVQNVVHISNLNKSIKLEQLIRGYFLSDDKWIIPFNGYQYKLIKESLDWDSARSYCRSRGGDLASLGFQSLHTRKIIREAINHTDYVWIGLNDKSSEGTWRWLSSTESLDGDYATNDISLWYQSSPWSNWRSPDCAVLYTSSAYAHPDYCYKEYYFLCEKQT